MGWLASSVSGLRPQRQPGEHGSSLYLQGRWDSRKTLMWFFGGRAAVVLWAAASHVLPLQPLHFCCPWMLTEHTAGTVPAAWGSCPVTWSCWGLPHFPTLIYSHLLPLCLFWTLSLHPAVHHSSPSLHLDFRVIDCFLAFLLPRWAEVPGERAGCVEESKCVGYRCFRNTGFVGWGWVDVQREVYCLFYLFISGCAGFTAMVDFLCTKQGCSSSCGARLRRAGFSPL